MRKVSPGQPLKIPASTYNAMLDATEDFRRRQLNRRTRSSLVESRSGVVLIRNLSGQDCAQFTVLGLSSVIITPGQNWLEFASRFCFDAVLPAEEHVKKFAVLQEPIASGRMGLAMVVGITPAWVVRIVGESSDYAGTAPGYIQLKTGVQGAQIIWEDAYIGANAHLAVVRLPQATGGGTNATVLAATTANITFSGLQTVDGVSMPAGALVLVKNQTTASQNGVYMVSVASWTRSGTLASGMVVSVRAGTTQGETLWMLTTSDPITPGTTALTFKPAGAFYG